MNIHRSSSPYRLLVNVRVNNIAFTATTTTILLLLSLIMILFSSSSSSSSSPSMIFVSAQNLRTPRPPGFYTASRMLNIRDQVVTYFRHAYDGYKKNAFPMDELKPISCKGTDHFGRYSMTAIDSLDMLALVGDYDEFFTIVDHLYQNVHFDADVTVSVFETTIRVIGSLTTAHDIALTLKQNLPTDQYPAAQRYTDQLLKVCLRIADKMISAFDTPTGIPFNEINLRSGSPDPTRGHATCPAAAGSLLLEFAYLSHLTGNCLYLQLARQAFLGLWKHRSPHNMVGMMIDIYNGFWLNTEANIGASVDSFYEYMVKAYVLSGDKTYLEMWEQASRSIYKHTYFSGWYLSSSVEFRGPMEAFDHRFNSLQTFWPGLQVLSGDVTNAVGSFEKIHCITKSLTFPPEYISIAEYVTQQPNPKKSGPGYPLRPEVIESSYFLHRATQDDYFLNVGEHFIFHLSRAKTRCGFAAILDVWAMTLEDKMESFLISETFKYLYLLFTPPKWKPLPDHHRNLSPPLAAKIFNLDEGFIVNTEAHAIPVTNEMKETYKKCSSELRLLPHMSENVIKDDWSVHESAVYEHFSQSSIASDINLHQRKCPVLDYWRDIAPAMDLLRNNDRCFIYVDTTILAPKSETQFKPKEMPQPKPIQIILPNGKKANVPMNMLTEAARVAAELRQSQHFREAAAAAANANADTKSMNAGSAAAQSQQPGQDSILMLEIPGDDLNPIMSSPLRLQLSVPQRLKNQQWTLETQHGVLKVPMLTTLPMLFIGNSDQILQLEFSTGLKGVGFLTGKSMFSPSVCMMKRPAPPQDDEFGIKNQRESSTAESTSYTTTATTSKSSSSSSSNSQQSIRDENNNKNKKKRSNAKSSSIPKLPEKSVSGPLFSAENHKLCDGASENEVEQILKRKIAIQYPELHANLTAKACRFGLLVLRGNCTFKEKIQRAQRLGAAFVVIANQDKDGGLLEMADSPTPMKTEVTIPAVFITNKDYESVSNYITRQEKQLENDLKLLTAKSKNKNSKESVGGDSVGEEQQSIDEKDHQQSTTTSPFSYIRVDAKIKCVEGVVDQFESIGIALMEVPNKQQLFLSPLRLKPVAQMLKEQSAGVFPQVLMNHYYETHAASLKDGRKISAEELINQHRCNEEDCHFYLSYFTNSVMNDNEDDDNNDDQDDGSHGLLPPWRSLKSLASRAVGTSDDKKRLLSLFAFRVGGENSNNNNNNNNRASNGKDDSDEEVVMMNSDGSKSSDESRNNRNNNKNAAQYGIVGTVIRAKDTTLVSSAFRFAKPLTYIMSRPFMFFRRSSSSSSTLSTQCKSLKIEIVNLADLRDETRREFEGTEAGIQVLLINQPQKQSQQERQQQQKENEKTDEENDDNDEDDFEDDFGVCMRLVGEDPDKPGRYLVVTGFETTEHSKNHHTMPSPKTKFNDLHVLLLRQKMSTIAEVTIYLKKNLGQFVVDDD